MNSLKDKIFLIYSLFAIGILVLASYSWYSARQLTSKIEELTEPNNKVKYLKEISTDLSKFTNLYLRHPDSVIYNSEHEEIINRIRISLQNLRAEYTDDEKEITEALDSIPDVLDSISKAYSEIRSLKRQFQDEFYERVENEILKNITINDLKDSDYVEEKVRTEIVKIIEKDSALKEIEEKKNDTGILNRIFKGNEKPEPKKSSPVDQVNKVKKQALLSSEIDDLFFSSKVEYIKNEVNKVLYQEQVKAIKVRDKERQIYNSNIALITKIEDIFNRIQREEDYKLFQTTKSTFEASKKFNKTLIFIIIAFGVSSLALLWFLFRDIERNKYYQKLLQRSERKANRKAREKQRFLSVMSHELRTPLTSILGYTELLNKNDENRNAIYSSAKYLLQIVNEIFDIAKIEAGNIQIQSEDFNLTQSLRELRRPFQELIQNANLRAEFILPEQEVFIRSDSFRIKQILYNLVHNAIKFTNEGYVRLKMETGEIIEDRIHIIFSVEDSGIGIELSDQERIFKEYQQAGTHKNKNQGIGLGLGLVKRIVHLLDGQIHLESAPGEGSKFTIDLRPLLCNPIPELPDSHREMIDLPSNALAGVEIYAIDDDPFLTQLYKNVLGKFGAKVTTSTNPIRAMEEILLHPDRKIDILITDIKMPEMKGFELIQELNKKNYFPAKNVAITANVFFEEEYKNEMHVFDLILSKPFTQDGFVRALRDLLRASPDSESNSKPKQEFPKDTSVPVLQSSESEFEQALVNGEYDFRDFFELNLKDKNLFQESLDLLIHENKKELNLAFSYLKNHELLPLAEKIHKLSGRFSQIHATQSWDAKKIELSLRSLNASEKVADLSKESPDFPALSEAESLLYEWEKINSLIEVNWKPDRIEIRG